MDEYQREDLIRKVELKEGHRLQMLGDLGIPDSPTTSGEGLTMRMAYQALPRQNLRQSVSGTGLRERNIPSP